MFPIPPFLYKWLAIGGVILLLGAAVWIQTGRLDTCKTEHAAFVAQVPQDILLTLREAKTRSLGGDLQGHDPIPGLLERLDHGFGRVLQPIAQVIVEIACLLDLVVVELAIGLVELIKPAFRGP